MRRIEAQKIDVSKPISRGDFLRARMAYLAQLREEYGADYASMISAINIHDELQARLLLMTWDDEP